MTDIRPYTITIDDDTIDDLHRRLSATRWPEAETPDDWSQGIPLAYTQAVIEYWNTEYDMQRLATRLNAYPNFLTEIDGLDIHFMHIRSSREDAQPQLHAILHLEELVPGARGGLVEVRPAVKK